MAVEAAATGRAVARSAGKSRSRAVRVLLVDDRGLFADPLCERLAANERIEVVGTATDGDEAVALAALLRPVVVLMDHDLTTSTGVDASSVIRETLPSVYVVMLGGSKLLREIDSRAASADERGASGEPFSAELIETVFDICSPSASGAVDLRDGDWR